MATGYMRLKEGEGLPRGMPPAPADLACWTALVHAWDDIELALGEVMTVPGHVPLEPDEREAGLTELRPFA